MTLGEIKTEALKLMYVRDNTDFDVSELAALREDENINLYLCNMPGSVNRCLSYIESRGVLPRKTRALIFDEKTEDGSIVRINPREVIDDYYDIERVICESGGRYMGDCDYRTEGESLALRYDKDARYTLEYKPRCKRISAATEDDYELDLPDDIASLIPFYIKSELYRDDEPAEAGEARNWFEQSIAQLDRARESNSGAVESFYSQNYL